MPSPVKIGAAARVFGITPVKIGSGPVKIGITPVKIGAAPMRFVITPMKFGTGPGETESGVVIGGGFFCRAAGWRFIRCGRLLINPSQGELPLLAVGKNKHGQISI